MHKYKFHWLMVSVSILGLVACATPSQYKICNDVQVTNNDCPDVTANVIVVNDINGM